jgi:hypothetical protein
VAASFPGDNAFISYYDPDPKFLLHYLLNKGTQSVYIPGLYYGPLNTGLKLARMKQMKLVMDGIHRLEIYAEIAGKSQSEKLTIRGSLSTQRKRTVDGCKTWYHNQSLGTCVHALL